MGFLDFLKKEKGGSDKLEVPVAPPTKKDLPTFPSPKEIPEVETKRKTSKPESPEVKKIEEKAFREQKEELEEREHMKLKKPLFVYLDSYKEMMKDVNSIKNTLKEGSDSLARIDEFKEDQDEEYKKWENQLKDIQKKLIYADKALFAKQER